VKIKGMCHCFINKKKKVICTGDEQTKALFILEQQHRLLFNA